MVVRTQSSRLRWWLALALGLTLALGGCSGDDGTDGTGTAQQADPAEDEATEDETAEESTDTADDAGEQAAAGEPSGDCPVDAGTVSDVVGVGFELPLDDVNELADGGTSCIYKGETDDVAVIAAISVATWDGSDERVDGVVEQTVEYFDDPVATPDLGDRAFLFDDDFGGTSLVVFVDGEQYSTGLSGAGWTGTPLGSLDDRQAILVQLYERATA